MGRRQTLFMGSHAHSRAFQQTRKLFLQQFCNFACNPGFNGRQAAQTSASQARQPMTAPASSKVLIPVRRCRLSLRLARSFAETEIDLFDHPPFSRPSEVGERPLTGG